MRYLVAFVCFPLLAIPIISVQPSSVVTTPGIFTADVVATGVTDLFAFQFDFGFDPSVVNADAVAQGPFLAQGGSTFFIPGAIDNPGGRVIATANTLLTAVPGVDGSGPLATFQLSAVGLGTSSINIFNLILLDSSLSGIAATIQNGSVTVSDWAAGSGVPEPSPLLLFGGGLLLIGCLRRRALACLLVVIAPVACVGQIGGPRLAGFDFNPKAIDVRGGPEDVTVDLHVTDDSASLLAPNVFISVSFSSPSGRQNVNALAVALPDSMPLDANFRAVVTIPRYSESGNWTVFSVSLSDAANQFAFLGTGALAQMGFPTVLSVTSVADTTPPTLTGLSFSPASIDVSSGPQDVTVTLHVTDDLSGMLGGQVFVQFQSPSGVQFRFGNGFLVPGSLPLDANFQATITMPQFIASGNWTLSGVSVADTVGNGTFLDTAALGALGFPTVLSVTSIPDTTPPTLTAFGFTPKSIDVSSAPQDVMVDFHVTDDLSGLLAPIAHVDVQFQSPSGTQFQFGPGFPLPGGLPLEADFQAVVRMPQFIENGDWTVAHVSVVDVVGNQTSLDRAALAALGFPTVLSVTSIADITPPTLTSLSYNPPSVDVSSGRRSVTISLGIADAGAGVSFVSASFGGPSTQFGVPVFFNLISGDAHTGVWQGSVTVPRYAEQGLWRIAFLELHDAVNNTLFLDASQIQALGFPTGVQVTSSPSDKTPPRLTSLTISPLAVNTSEGSQVVNLDFGLTDDISGVYFTPTDTPFFIHSPSFFSQPITPQSPFLNSGTLLNGQWHLSFTVPQNAESGAWTIGSFFVRDNALNSSFLSTEQLRDLGFPTSFVVLSPNVTPDGTVDGAGGTVSDTVFGALASVTFPPGEVSVLTTVAIDVLSTPASVPAPAGFFAKPASFFTNIELTPEPAFPLPSPGLTVTLPLSSPLTPGIFLSLYRLDPLSGLPVPAQNRSGRNIRGTVDPGGQSVTFAGVVRLSTLLAYRAIPTNGDVNGDGTVDCADIAIVRGAFGARPGLPGFDPGADLNQDGVIDIRDLALLSRLLPAGMVCQ